MKSGWKTFGPALSTAALGSYINSNSGMELVTDISREKFCRKAEVGTLGRLYGKSSFLSFLHPKSYDPVVWYMQPNIGVEHQESSSGVRVCTHGSDCRRKSCNMKPR